MIWFTCKQCGEAHGRPESSIGTMVFCACGMGNIVPWASTAEEPETMVVEELPPLPVLEPIVFDAEPVEDTPAPRRQRQKTAPPRDPERCLNHQQVPLQDRCRDCGEGFCRECLVYVQGQALCGPCKNFRMRQLHRPAPASHLALVSFLVAIFAGPLAFCLFPMGLSSGVTHLSLLALVPQTIALVLGVLALRKIESGAKVGGQALALSGVLMSLFLVIWTLFFSIYGARWWS